VIYARLGFELVVTRDGCACLDKWVVDRRPTSCPLAGFLSIELGWASGSYLYNPALFALACG
jgi:hypothetical protein